jgi:hypothetical protein
MAIPELEGDPPRPSGRNCPLPPAIASEPVKTHGFKARQVFKALGLVEQLEAASRQRLIEPGEATSTLFCEALSRTVGPGSDHSASIYAV